MGALCWSNFLLAPRPRPLSVAIDESLIKWEVEFTLKNYEEKSTEKLCPISNKLITEDSLKRLTLSNAKTLANLSRYETERNREESIQFLVLVLNSQQRLYW